MASDITITDNTLDVNPQPGGAAVSMYTDTYNGGAPSFSNIVITGNTFIRPGSAAIRLDSFHGGIIAGNCFEEMAAPPVELKRCSGIGEEDKRPNILWLVAEDMSPHFGCYGDQAIRMPNVDRLAARGVLFERAFVTAPICSPSRSALITGMYQTSIGARTIAVAGARQDSASLRGRTGAAALSAVGVLHVQRWLLAVPAKRKDRLQFRVRPAHLRRHRLVGAQDGATVFRADPTSRRQDPRPAGRTRQGATTTRRLYADQQLSLPPYYPRTPAMLDDWAATLDAVRITDKYVGEIVERLRTEGILEQTVVFFLSDHGVSHGVANSSSTTKGRTFPWW